MSLQIKLKKPTIKKEEEVLKTKTKKNPIKALSVVEMLWKLRASHESWNLQKSSKFKEDPS